MAAIVPPLYSVGVYGFSAPYTTLNLSTKELTCIAIRSFQDVYNENVDPYLAYYLPLQDPTNFPTFTEDSFKADAADNVPIVSLLAKSGDVYHIPASYITAVPVGGTVPYKHVVLSVSLGPLPDTVDLSALKTKISQVVSDTIGIAGTVYEAVAPTLDGDAISPAASATLEAARQAAITDNTTDYQKRIALEQTLIEKNAQIVALQGIIVANGYTI